MGGRSLRRATSETLLVGQVFWERHGRWVYDVVVAVAVTVFLLACVHYGSRGW